MRCLFVVAVSIAVTAAAGNLVQVFPADGAQLDILSGLGIAFYAQMANSYVGVLNPEQAAHLDQRGITYQDFGAAPSQGEFFIVTPPGEYDLEGASKVVAEYARILVPYAGMFLVVGQPPMIEYLPNLRYHIAHVPRQPIVLPHRFAPVITSGTKYNAVVQWVINQITPGELARFIRDLSGENPVTVGGRTDTIRSRYYTNTKNSVALRYYVERVQSYGVDSVAYHLFNQDSNVIATRVGRIYPRQQYLIGGHIDDVPSTGNAPGADDNLTGTVAGLIAAKYIRGIPFKRTIKFVAWNSEEQGLYGSAAYASQARARGDSIRGYFNGDMIAYETSNFDSVRCCNANRPGSIALSTKFNQMNIDYSLGLRIRVSTSAPANSDHYSFWQNGYEAVDVFEDDANPWYHTVNDRITTLDTVYYCKVVKCMVASILELAEPDTVFPGVAEQNTVAINRAGPLAIRSNPTRRVVQFEMTDPGAARGAIDIYDVAGQLVNTKAHVVTPNHGLRLTLKPGVYFAQYRSGDKTSTGKFVVLD